MSAGSWIIDSGASSHMCYDFSSLSQSHPVKHITPVYLPDSSIKYVQNVGQIELSTSLILTECLHIPSFKYNLLSVSKLSSTANIHFDFFN